MSMKFLKINLFLCACTFLFQTENCLADKLRIPFWHSFTGHLGKTVKLLSREFNSSQNKYQIVPIYKGNYPELFTSFAAAYRAKQHPPLVQIHEIGTATMLGAKDLIKPIYKIMQQDPIDNFSSRIVMPSLRQYYGDEKQRLVAMPFNSSSAVLYYNRALFEQAGIKNAPATWPQVEAISKKLIAKKLVGCGFTTAFPSWINIESFVHWHGQSFVKQDKLKTVISYQLPALKYHLSMLKKWHQQGIYKYAGRDSNATALFTSGTCAMMIQSSGSYISLKNLSLFNVDVSYMPFWPKYRKVGANGVIGGAALWVINGFSNETYNGINHFLAFLAQDKVQQKWQRLTGYFPILAKPLNTSKSLDDNLKASKVALEQVSNSSSLSPGERLGYYAQIRLFNDEQIEAILAGIVNVEQALKHAENHANKLLKRFDSTKR